MQHWTAGHYELKCASIYACHSRGKPFIDKEWLTQDAETRSYLYNTSKPTKVASGWRVIARELLSIPIKKYLNVKI